MMQPDGHENEVLTVHADRDQRPEGEKGRRIVGSERQSLAKDLVKRYLAGEGIRALAASTGRSYGFVHRVLTESGVQLRQRGGHRRRREALSAEGRPTDRELAREYARASRHEPDLPLGNNSYVVSDLLTAKGNPTIFVVVPSRDFATNLAKRQPGSSGIESSTISVDAYLDTNDKSLQQGVLAALDSVVVAFGFDVPVEFEVRRGSIFRRAKAALKKGAEAAELGQRLAKLERAIELTYLDRAQAEIDAAKAGAVQQLLESLADVPQACIRVGSILLLKFENTRGPVVLIRNLSQLEIHALERYPEIQTDPPKALEALATAVSSLEPVEADGALLNPPSET